jgi:hypothetical protein
MSSIPAVNTYVEHNSSLMKEWFWEDDLLNCVFKRESGESDTDDIDDFVDGLVITILNNSLSPCKIMLSLDIGEYMDVFYGLVEVFYEQDHIKIKYTNSNFDETFRTYSRYLP